MRSRYRFVPLLVLIFLFILLSDTIRDSILYSLTMCFKILIPSLFPYFVLSGMLMDFGMDTALPPTWCSMCIGLICGYPLGSRTVCNYYSQKKLSKSQAQTLLMCTANASPAFVVVVLGQSVLQDKKLGFLLLLCQSINALLLFLLLVPKKADGLHSIQPPCQLVSSLIKHSKGAVEQIFFVCSMTVIFGIIYDLLAMILPANLCKLIAGYIEILRGGTALDNSSVYLLASVLGFSGLCVWSQCIYYILGTDLNILYLIVGKIHAALTLPLILSLFLENTILH